MTRSQVEVEMRNWLRALVDQSNVFLGDKELAMAGFIECKKAEARELLRKWRKAGS